MCAVELKQTPEIPFEVKTSLRALSLRANFSWTLVGNLVYAVCQWGMLIVLAKLGTPEMVGRFGIALAVTAPVIMFSNLQLRTIQATDAKHEFNLGDYLAVRLLSLLFAAVVIVCITKGSSYRLETASVILAIGFSKIPESLTDLLYGQFTQQEQLQLVAKSMMINGILSVTAFGSALCLTHSVFWAAVALSSVNLVMLFSYDLRNANRLSKSLFHDHTKFVSCFPLPRWNRQTLLRIFGMSLPLGIVMMLVSLNVNIPRYFIQTVMGEKSLGVFVAMAYIITAVNPVVNALGQSMSPRLAKYFCEGKLTTFRSLVLKVTAAGIVIGLVFIGLAVAFGQQLITFMYRSEYAQDASTFVILVVAASVTIIAVFLRFAITAARCLRIQTPLWLLISGMTALISWLLVPKIGLMGAAIALLSASLIQLVGNSWVLVAAYCKTRRNLKLYSSDHEMQVGVIR